MKIKSEILPYNLNFKFDAGTSRGVMTERKVWFWKLVNLENNILGIGEVAPLEGLSLELNDGFEEYLYKLSKELEEETLPDSVDKIPIFVNSFISSKYPSVRFALELAILNLLKGGGVKLFDTPFSQHKRGIPINGLVWMGDKELMLKRVKEKLAQGYNCIKLKIGALDFSAECEILEYIRSRYTKDEIILRLDANGAFGLEEAMEKLKTLARYDIHSIEQPVRQGNRKAIKDLCESSPIPIALDEELIGIHNLYEKVDLLEEIKPQYIILKPSLLGGLNATKEWIDIAEARGISWWLTSALESNVGLNAISQFADSLDVTICQGLGTGQLFHNNIEFPLSIRNAHLYLDESKGFEVVIP